MNDRNPIQILFSFLLPLFLLVGCGGRPTIPVEEHSSLKRPPVKEVYYPAAGAVRSADTPAVVVSRAQREPVAYQAVEPEPQWQEIPPPEEVQQARAYTAPPPSAQPRAVPKDDPLLSLLQKIEQAMQQQDYGRAEGMLERALRIDSQRAGLWHDLGRVRYRQGNYKEAVTLARRSNGLVERGSVLQEENWSLIARAKEALGDMEGARAAWRKAGR